MLRPFAVPGLANTNTGWAAEYGGLYNGGDGTRWEPLELLARSGAKVKEHTHDAVLIAAEVNLKPEYCELLLEAHATAGWRSRRGHTAMTCRGPEPAAQFDRS